MQPLQRVQIIAEAGVNHNGSIARALELVAVAAECGADIVKFQTFSADSLVTKTASKAEYQKVTTVSEQSQYEMLKALELSVDDHHRLIADCRENGIRFLSTPFDLKSVDLLRELGVATWKISSGEITNYPLLRKIGHFNQDIILSSGMATLDELRKTIAILESFGTTRTKITVLHCTTEYPAPFADVNLWAIQTIATTFPGIRVGYSDHTSGIEIPVAAVALGATVIEKHFTLDKNLPGPDHKASLDPAELRDMVSAIRNVAVALGDGIKTPRTSEIKNIAIARKSIVAAKTIQKGELFTDENLTVKRPGIGVSPMHWPELIGTAASRNYKADELIDA